MGTEADNIVDQIFDADGDPRALEAPAIRNSFLRGATIEQVAQWYTKWTREELQVLWDALDEKTRLDDTTVWDPAEGVDRVLAETIVWEPIDVTPLEALFPASAWPSGGGFAEEPEAVAPAPPAEPEIVLDPTQVHAVELMCSAPLLVVTGGAGTGKTTITKVALARLAAMEKPPLVALCAPTGKAARRLREATGVYAQTVHRLLEWAPGDDLMWTYHAGNALPYDVIVLDEVSMLDTALASAFFDAVATQRCRVILTGDVNQLPSVGPGRVLADIIAQGRTPVVTLEHVHRQAQKSWVYRNAPRILAGEELELDGNFDDFIFYEQSDESRIGELVVDVFEAEVNKIAEGLDDFHSEDAFDKVQICIPQKTGAIGCERINTLLQQAIHGDITRDDGFSVSKDLAFTDGDKVIQTRNNYTLGVMNGETGIVVGRTPDTLEVKVDDDVKRYSKHDALDLQLGYAITIHKMQGSQADTVILLCSSQHGRMLTRQLFYTGVTRAAKRLVLIGDRPAIARALKVGTVMQRQTKLIERLNYVMDGQ